MESLTLVDKSGHEYKVLHLSAKHLKMVLFSNQILGFFFDISDKVHRVARVYLPKLDDILPKWKHIWWRQSKEANMSFRARGRGITYFVSIFFSISRN